MIHNIFFCNRKPGLSRLTAQRHLREVHGPLARRIPGMLRYVQGCTLSLYGDQAAPDWLSEQWFESKEAVEAGFNSKENLDFAKPDTFYFSAKEQLPGRPLRMKLQATDDVLMSGPATRFKFVNCFKPTRDSSRDAFADYWKTMHGPALIGVPGLRRYTQSLCLPSTLFGAEEDAFWGIEHLWFDSIEDLETGLGSEFYQEKVRPDWSHFASEPATISFAVVEYVVSGSY